MWFGTSSGLDRYDGHSFVHYGPGDVNGLASRGVETLFEDRRGRLWVGGRAGCLATIARWIVHHEFTP